VPRWSVHVVKIPGLQAVSWHRSNRIFLGTFTGILAAVYLFVLLIDPYGVVPISLPFERPITNSSRQMFSQILRTGRYDSIVAGTSTSQLLDPAALGRALGGHFANYALPASTAGEQVRLMDYFRRTVAAPKAVLIGLDHEWCYRDANAYVQETEATREKDFPAWAYDENRWNGLLYLLNTPAVEAAGRVVNHLVTGTPGRVRDDGFEVFVPPESAYDLARVRSKLARGAADPRWDLAAAARPDTRGGKPMDFPALPWLDAGLARLPDETRKVLVFPPVHVRTLPAPGSPREAWEAECKRQVAAIARRHGALLVDWRIVSPLTTDDSHFWDPLHYRLPVGYQLIDDLDHIIHEGRDSPDGSYRILVH
jgi:hypothetical protein